MSTRHLKRLQEQLKAGPAQAADEGDTEEEEEQENQQGSSPAPFNPFDLLSDDETAEARGKEEEDEDADVDAPQQRPHQAGVSKPVGKSKKKKGKKKTGGTANGNAATQKQQESVEPGAGKDRGTAELDEIDLLVRELNQTTVARPEEPFTTSSSSSSTAVPGKGRGTGATAGQGQDALLAVDVRSLRGDDELRRIFGADVVQSVDRQELAEAATRRRQAAGVRGIPASRRRPLKRGVLVTPKEHWPPFDGGLSMENMAPPPKTAAAAEYTEGQAVLYQTRDRTLVPAIVMQVDRSMQPPQYGVRRDGTDGVVYTERERLRPADAAKGAARLNGRPLFRYVHSSTYRTTQLLFEQAQASHDPNAIAALLQHAPYHVDSLLAMHDLYRHMGENSYAEDCLARALYCLEMGWHPSFSIATANCRMSVEEEENRGLFLALFRHIQALSRQGCHRTALEVCKLLLALEPEDPMGALMLLDYLALRAGKYDYLRDFVAKFEDNRSLALLPNYAYATAMARLRQQQQQATAAAATSATPATPQPSALELAVQAVLLHPLVVPRLLAKLQDKGSAREGHWSALMERRLFAKASDGGSASLAHVANIYVERSALLWKAPDALELLRQACVIAAELTEGKSADAAATAALARGFGGDGSMAGPGLGLMTTREVAVAAAAAAEGVKLEDWECVRREAFPATEVNDYRHLRLHDFSDDVASLPREELNAAMAAGGVNEVEDALADLQEQLLAAAQQQQQQRQQGQGAAPVSEEELRNANPLMMLLRSLMPWVNAGQQPDYGADEGAQGGDQAH